MLRINSIYWKIVFTIFTYIFLVSIITFVFVILLRQGSSMPSYIGKELSIGAKIAALEIEKEINNLNIKDLSELKLLNPLLEELSKITESQIMITDINGKILITFPKQKS